MELLYHENDPPTSLTTALIVKWCTLTLPVPLTCRYVFAFLSHHVTDRTHMFPTPSTHIFAVTRSLRALRLFRHMLCILKRIFSPLSGFAQSRYLLAGCGTRPFAGVLVPCEVRAPADRWGGTQPLYTDAAAILRANICAIAQGHLSCVFLPSVISF